MSSDTQIILLVTFVVILLFIIGAWLLGRKLSVNRRRNTQVVGPTGREIGWKASLYVLAGPNQGVRYQLDPRGSRIGRREDNEIRIDAPLVSRSHAIIEYRDGAWRIIDQDSTNGTWVDGMRVADQPLTHNTRIQIGPSVFLFQMAGAEQTPPPGQYATVSERPQRATKEPVRIHRLADYDLTELGRGGEGIVYRGTSRIDGSVVAIKVLQSEDPYITQKFKQAGDELGRMLHHPHIIETYHFGSQDGMYYIIMEYAPGRSLRERLQIGVPYPPAEAVRILGQTCDALDFAHRHKIVHRDVKPSNILFGAADEVKLSDFGIAKLMTAPTYTQAGWILGTPEYMSYEQARGQTVVPQSDLYSLGVVAYQLFTGQLPFTASGSNMVQILDQHLKERPVPPRQLNPTIPPAVEAAILRTLEKEASRRFKTCEEFARALGYTAPMHHGSPKRPEPSPHLGRSGRLRLVIQDTNIVIPITGTELVLNRAVLGGHPSVTRDFHARIALMADGRYWLRDEHSTNGTYWNGQRIFDWVPLQPNDVVAFGQVVARVVMEGGSTPELDRSGTGKRTRIWPS